MKQSSYQDDVFGMVSTSLCTTATAVVDRELEMLGNDLRLNKSLVSFIKSCSHLISFVKKSLLS